MFCIFVRYFICEELVKTSPERRYWFKNLSTHICLYQKSAFVLEIIKYWPSSKAFKDIYTIILCFASLSTHICLQNCLYQKRAYALEIIKYWLSSKASEDIYTIVWLNDWFGCGQIYIAMSFVVSFHWLQQQQVSRFQLYQQDHLHSSQRCQSIWRLVGLERIAFRYKISIKM